MVLVLGLAGFSYIAFKEKAKLEKEKIELIEKEKKSFQKSIDIGEELAELSALVGFRSEDNEQSATARSSGKAISDRLTDLRDDYPDYISKETKTLDRAIEGLIRIHADAVRKLADAQQNLSDETAARQQAESSINEVETEKNAKIAELQAQINDEQQRAQAQLDEDNNRISNLQSQLDEAESRARDVEARLTAAQERSAKEITQLNARIQAQSRKLEVLRDPDTPDGKIIGAVSGSGLVYIDIGKKDNLHVGNKFKVFRFGKGGELIPKGSIEVRKVEEDSALCGILNQVDEYDPIVKNDVVVNPLFARDREKVFFFLGEFPATYSKAFVKNRLTALGAQVAEKVDSNLDFLVLGDKAQGEDAVEVTEMDEFKRASEMGVQFIRLKELVDYIKY